MSLPIPTPTASAVVTGASSGIGAALVESLARRGHALILIARREDRLRELAERLSTTYGVAVEVVPCDLASPEDREKVLVDLASREISVLCLNAGFATYGELTRLDADREREEVELNVVAVHDFVVRLLPAMVERGSGAVLVTGSTAGNQPSPNNATYAATKAFANTLAESLHGELKGSGVTCTLLAPGPVKTEFSDVAHIGRLDDLLPGFAWVSAERAAERAIRGMERGKRRVVPGVLGKLNHVGGVYTPRAVSSPILRRVYGDLS